MKTAFLRTYPAGPLLMLFLLASVCLGQTPGTGAISGVVYDPANRIAGEVRPAPHTTPESRDLLALLAEGVERGVTEGVMEVSSHALDQGRVWGVPYDVAIFTNLTQDHLDYHGTMEAYFVAKQKLFAGVGAPVAVTVKVSAVPTAKVVEAALVIAGASKIVTK